MINKESRSFLRSREISCSDKDRDGLNSLATNLDVITPGEVSASLRRCVLFPVEEHFALLYHSAAGTSLFSVH